MNTNILRCDPTRGDYYNLCNGDRADRRARREPAPLWARVVALLVILAAAVVGLVLETARAEAVIGASPNGVKVCRSNSCLESNGREIVFPCSSIQECDTVARAEIAKYGATRTTGSSTWDFRKQYPVTYRAAPPPAPVDTDSDGVPDSADKCPAVPASTPDGCPAAPQETWTKCADENQLCTFTGTRRVRYGAGTTWTSARDIVAINGGVRCGNAVFGDPIFGTAKECQLSSVMPAPQPEPPAPTLGAASLSWQPPTENTNGTPLTDLTGYVISYGTTCEGRSLIERIEDPSVTSLVIRNLMPGTYCFGATAYDSFATQSPPSNLVTKTIE